MVKDDVESRSEIKQVLRVERPTGRRRTLWISALLVLLLLGGLAYMALAPTDGNAIDAAD